MVGGSISTKGRRSALASAATVSPDVDFLKAGEANNITGHGGGLFRGHDPGVGEDLGNLAAFARSVASEGIDILPHRNLPTKHTPNTDSPNKIAPGNITHEHTEAAALHDRGWNAVYNCLKERLHVRPGTFDLGIGPTIFLHSRRRKGRQIAPHWLPARGRVREPGRAQPPGPRTRGRFC